VLPTLTPEDLAGIAAGRVSLDRRIREFIHRELAYPFVETDDGPTAAGLERAARGGALSTGKPLLKPP
jgi:hypothetical protein